MSALDEFNQAVAESQNDASHESAHDLLSRAIKFAEELRELVDRQALPPVVVDGVLMSNIQMRAYRTIRIAERLAKVQAKEQP